VEPKLARFDALRAALGERAERLAVVHLDLEATPGRPERVVASFLDAADEVAVLARGAGAKKQPAAAKESGHEAASEAKLASKASASAAKPGKAGAKPGKSGKAASKHKPKSKASGAKFPSGIPKYD